MPITAFHAGILGLIFVALSARVIKSRRAGRVPLGDGGLEELRRPIRIHANFAEYVPLALALLLLAETLRTDWRLLHTAGLALVIGRLVHAYGLSRTPEKFAFRVAGMAATLTTIGVLAVTCVASAARTGLW
jgi:uncharacterized protein